MKTQGEVLLQACRRRAMTYMELQTLGVSTCVHKRLAEAERHHLRPGEQLVRDTNAQGLRTFKVRRG